MVSGATVTSDGLPPVAAERARPGGPVTATLPAPPLRRARDGHADQPGPARPAHRRRRRPRRPGPRRSPSCARPTGCSAPTAPTPSISRLGRGEIDPRRLPARGRRGAGARRARAERESGGAFDVRRPARRRTVLDPSGVVKGWAARARRRRTSRALPDTDFCLSAGGDMVCRTVDPAGPPWRIGIEDPHDPTPAASPSSRCAPAPSPPPAPPTAARTSSTPAPAARPTGVASVTVVGRRR